MHFFCKYICAHCFDWCSTYIMSIIVSKWQHCDEQQFRTLSCVHYTIFSVVKSDLFIRALLLDRILVTEKTTRTPRVHLVPQCNWNNSSCIFDPKLWFMATSSRSLLCIRLKIYTSLNEQQVASFLCNIVGHYFAVRVPVNDLWGTSVGG